jgi:hypothetical protein
MERTVKLSFEDSATPSNQGARGEAVKPWKLRDLLGVNNFDILFSMLNVSNRFGA